jgi:hypothetical protein
MLALDSIGFKVRAAWFPSAMMDASHPGSRSSTAAWKHALTLSESSSPLLIVPASVVSTRPSTGTRQLCPARTSSRPR